MTKNHANTDTNTPEADAAVSTGRSVMLKLDTEHAALVGVAEGSEMKRTDYIRARWQAGTARGPISKELSKLQGKDVPYQIVFQATKGIEGGPAKEEKAKDPADTAAA